MPDPNDEALSLAIAGGAIATALMDLLIERKIITRDDAMSLLTDAQKKCGATLRGRPAQIVSALYAKARDNA